MGNISATDATNTHSKRSATHSTVLEDLAANLDAFRVKDIFCDVVLRVGEKSFRGHRNILAACSPYFKATFTGSSSESGECNVTLRGVDADMMPAILHFAYTGQIKLTERLAMQILHDAHNLQILALVDACYAFLEDNIDIYNCITIYGLAETYSNSELRGEAETFILIKFPAVSETKQFLGLPAEDLIRIIREDLLAVDSEDVVCEAVFRWLHSDDEARQPVFAEVLKHVRLTFVSTALLHRIDEEEEIIKMSAECTRLVKQALFCKLLTKEQKEKPRKGYLEVQKT